MINNLYVSKRNKRRVAVPARGGEGGRTMLKKNCMARVKQDYVVVDPKGKHTTLTIENVGLIPIMARVRSVNVTAYSINPTYYLIHPNGSQDVNIEIHIPRHIDPLHDAFKVATLTLPQKFLERVKTEVETRKSPSDTVCRTLWEEVVATYNPITKDIIVPTRSVGY